MRLVVTPLVLVMAFGCSGPSAGSGSCGDRVEWFDHPLIPVASMTSITPLGNLAPPQHTLPTGHMYFNFDGDLGEIDIFAPGAVRVESIESQRYLVSSFREGEEDYSIRLRVCDEVFVTIGHASSVDSAIADSDNFPAESCSMRTVAGETVENCYLEPNVALQPGDRLGTAGGFTSGLDFGAVDDRVNGSVINPERTGHLQHARCVTDLFDAEIRSGLAPVFGRGETGDDFFCGQVTYDVPGSLQGVWYRDDYTPALGYAEEYAIALVRDNFDPELGAASIGSVGTSIDNQVITFTRSDDGATNRDFATVDDTEVYCYGGVGSALRVQRQGDGSLLVDGTNEGCTEPLALGPNALRFVR